MQAATKGIKGEFDQLVHEAKENGRSIVAEATEEEMGQGHPVMKKATSNATEEAAEIDATVARVKGQRRYSPRKKVTSQIDLDKPDINEDL